MTREEAIESLRGILTEAVEFENSVCYVTEEDREPLEMAIKALEQEPCNAVSREAVLDLCDSKDPDYKVIHFKEDVECLPPVTPQMMDQWQELKETIIEMRDNNGTGTQQEACKFLANLMDVLEKQMSGSEIPNSSDCISRLAAIDALDKRFDSIPMEQTTEILLLRKDLRGLPPIYPEPSSSEKPNKWIPVNEKLPEENKTVIASTDYCIYPEARYTEKCGWEGAYESGADYWVKIKDVIAWMSLPKHYEPQESEDKE